MARVPGSFEIPLAAKRMAVSGNHDAVLCLGCVIRGGTTHYDHVVGGAADGIAQVSREADIPVLFGLVTADTVEQAIERAGSKMGNQGAKAAAAAIEMVNLLEKLE